MKTTTMTAKVFRAATVAARHTYTKYERVNKIAAALNCTKKFGEVIEAAVRNIPSNRPTPEDARIVRKLQKIADALPTTGHSMGSVQTVSMGKYSARSVRTQEYAKSCTWSPTHGSIRLNLKPSEYSKASVIGGIVTIVTGPTRSTKIKKCKVIEREGSKQSAYYTWEETFVAPSIGYHGTYDECMKRLNAKVKTKKRVAGRTDSIAAGNCVRGTDLFIRQHQLNPEKRYSKSFLYKMATESELLFVKRIFGEK